MKQQILASGDSGSVTLGQVLEVSAVDLLITEDNLPSALSEQGEANFDEATFEWVSLGTVLIENNDAGFYMEFQMLKGWQIVAVTEGSWGVSE